MKRTWHKPDGFALNLQKPASGGKAAEPNLAETRRVVHSKVHVAKKKVHMLTTLVGARPSEARIFLVDLAYR